MDILALHTGGSRTRGYCCRSCDVEGHSVLNWSYALVTVVWMHHLQGNIPMFCFFLA